MANSTSSMDGFRYSDSQAAPGVDWHLLPKPRAHAMMQHSTSTDSPLSPELPSYTTIGDSSLEETQLTTPPYMASPIAEPDCSLQDDPPSSPDGWSKRQLSCLPKSSDLSEVLEFVSQNTDESPVKADVAPNEKMPPKDGRSSPEPNCSICLEKVVNRSFTNGCLHTFCFSCLVQWSKIKAECPLCKQAFKSIIHNVQENHKYDEYHVVTPLPAAERSEFSEFRDFITALEVSLPSFREQGRFGQPFRYSTTVTSDHQRIIYSSSAPWVIPSTPTISDRWRRYGFTLRHSRRANFRKNVYTRDLWAQPPVDVTGRYRECSPEFYRLNPAQVHRLAPWLDRELNALINSNLTTIVLDVILNGITRYNIMSPEFHRLMLPHLNDRTNHFIHEFFSFARSLFDMIGYDQSVIYGPNPSRTMHVVLSDDSSSDSDVLIISPNVAGPSGVGLRPAAPHTSAELNPDDSDDCQVVQYVKPRHERTPEIIDLLSDDEGQVINTMVSDPVPVLSDDSNSPQSLPESTDSEYLPNKGKCKKVLSQETDTKPVMRKRSCYPSDNSDSSELFSDVSVSGVPLLKKRKKLIKLSKERKPSKTARHSTDTKSTTKKKEKSRKIKSHSKINEPNSSDEDLTALAKRIRNAELKKSRRVSYSSDEAGPSSSYRKHLRSGNRPQCSACQPDSRSSSDSLTVHDWLPSFGNGPPIDNNSIYQHIFNTTSDDVSLNPYLPLPMRGKFGSSSYTDSGTRFFGFSTQQERRSNSPLPFVDCEATHSRSSHAASTSSSTHRAITEPQKLEPSSPVIQTEPSAPHVSPVFYSNWLDMCDTNLPSTSGINKVQSPDCRVVLKRKHKPSNQPESSGVDRKHSRKKSKPEHKSCRKVHLRDSSSPEHRSLQSWVIKTAEDAQPSIPETSVHSSPTTDTSEGRPRLKSIIIARQNTTPNSLSLGASSPSYSSRHSKRKHKSRRFAEITSSSGSDDW